ncbi:MAG: TonB-dependent receptor, partial [Sphingomonas bacterium]|nr:TonB-dependent receptor [Sphingomonas bacterium]
MVTPPFAETHGDKSWQVHRLLASGKPIVPLFEIEIMYLRPMLLASVALMLPHAALAQAAAPAPSTTIGPEQATPTQGAPDDAALDAEEDATVTVIGQRPRGSVVGDIPAENVLTTRDIRATGATSISELLDTVSAQTGSARGRSSGRPVLLLNVLRISGFRELRDLPPEAIERMEILPEEVALKYGYSADQRVVNIVLRQRFNSTGVEARAKAATDGGYVAGQAETTRLLIRNGQRTSLNLRVDGNGSLTEAERDIVLAAPTTTDPRDSRTLVGHGRSARLTGTVNRTILGDVGATLTGEVGRASGRSRFGLDTLAGDALVRATTSDSAALGFALNTQQDKWRLSSTGNADLSHSVSRSDRDLTVDDRSRSNRRTLTLDGTATGPLLALPAGDANATFRLAVGRTDLDSRAIRAGIVTATDLGRTSGEASVSLDLPLTKRGSALGRLTANANAGVTQLSDFGTLTSLGAGLNWAPATRLSLIASVTREEGPPSLQQLGDPLLETPGIRFFDATRGATVTVTTLTGGNLALAADRRRVMKLGANWQPSEKLDLRLRANYVRSSIDRPQASFPAVSAALEAAFPNRFVRDGGGNLIRVDLRPVNFLSSRRD